MERRAKFMCLSRRQVRSATAECGLPGHIDNVEPMEGGRANTLYRLRREDGREFVLRLYTRDSASCLKEAALARKLARSVPMPALEVVHAGPLPRIGVPGAVFALVEGDRLDRVLAGGNASTTLARAIGRVMAAIAAVEFPRRGDLVADEDSLAVRPWIFGGKSFNWSCMEDTPAGARLGPELSRRLLEFEARCEKRWPETADARHVHGDFNPTNILVRGEEVAAVLDWEFAHAGDPLMDFGNILRRRDTTPLPEWFPEALAEGFLGGGGALPADWRARAEYLDLSSACEFLSSVEDRPQLHAAAQRQVRDTLALWNDQPA